jgi:hypothetical protein
MNAFEVANIIERFIEGTGSDWEWDDFISVPIKDPKLEKIRIRCLELDMEFPPEKSGEYTNKKGLEVLSEYFRELKRGKE